MLGVVLALVLRAIVPVGWMPTAGPDGIVVTLCADGGLRHVLVDADGRRLGDAPAAPGERPVADQLCAFAQIATWFTVPVAPIVLRAVRRRTSGPVPPAAAPALRRRRRARTARAPPG